MLGFSWELPPREAEGRLRGSEGKRRSSEVFQARTSHTGRNTLLARPATLTLRKQDPQY